MTFARNIASFGIVLIFGVSGSLSAENTAGDHSPKRVRPSAKGKSLEYMPLDGGSKLQYHGIDKEKIWTPPLVGKNPNDPQIRKEFLDGTTFTVKVVGYQKSSTIPKGAIISQVPKEWEGVDTPGEIRVIVSLGN